MKTQGVPASEAGKTINAELKAQHPDWNLKIAGQFVQTVYADPATP